MKVVPLTYLKAGSKGKIVGFIESENAEESQKLIRRLTSLGFHNGREVQVLRQNSSAFQVKTGNNNPFAMGKAIAEKIKVSAEDGDVFENTTDIKQAGSIIHHIKKNFSAIKNKIQKPKN